MKLVDWAKKAGINYLTAYRWFKSGNLPPTVSAYQTATGTILVEEKENTDPSNNEAISLFLKKTVEFSNNQASVEDFAAFVISNFSLKLNENNSPSIPVQPEPEPLNKSFETMMSNLSMNGGISNPVITTSANYLTSNVDGLTFGSGLAAGNGMVMGSTGMTGDAMMAYNTTTAYLSYPPLTNNTIIKTASLNAQPPVKEEENIPTFPRKRGRPKKEIK